MSVHYDVTPRPGNDATDVAVSTGEASLGGTLGIRVIVDDAVLTSKEDVLLALESAENEIIRQTWPAA